MFFTAKATKLLTTFSKSVRHFRLRVMLWKFSRQA